MKKLLIALFLVAGSFAVQAQELKWQTNLDEAVKLSKNGKKPILMFFTGSDWCGWCMKLQKEVLKTPEFAKWADENVVLLELDFPRRTPQSNEIKKQNFELQQFFSVRGYPTVWFATATKDKKTGKVAFTQLGSTGYVAGGPTAWLDGANKILKKS